MINLFVSATVFIAALEGDRSGHMERHGKVVTSPTCWLIVFLFIWRVFLFVLIFGEDIFENIRTSHWSPARWIGSQKRELIKAFALPAPNGSMGGLIWESFRD